MEYSPSANSNWKYLLLATCTFPFIILLILAPFTRPSPNLPGIVCIISITYYSSLVGFWAGFGKSSWRWLCVIALVPLITSVTALIWSSSDAVGFFLLICVIVVTLAITTLILRKMKGRLAILNAGDEFTEGLQFGVKDIAIWTLGVAMACTIVRVFRSVFDSIIPNDAVLFICVISVSLAVNAVFSIWAFFGKQITWYKILAIALLAIAGSLSIHLTAFNKSELFIGVLLGNQLWLLVTMLIGRKMDYRFVRC